MTNHRRPARTLPILAAAILTLAALPTTSIAGPRVDPDTGRSLAVYPASPTFDHVHMQLKIDIPNPAEPRMIVEQTLDLIARGRTRDSITLDAQGLHIKSVEARGRPAEYTQTDTSLTISFDPPVLPTRPVTLVTRYEVTHMPHDGLGINHVIGDSPVIFTQGQTNHNSEWFPCHDWPNERLSTELIVTVPEGYSLLSNGGLKNTPRTRNGKVTWHWHQADPHPAYLVTLVVGKFSRVPLPDTAGTGVPMHIWSPVGTASKAVEQYASTSDILDFFQTYFDEPYPWAKYDQIAVPGYGLGAMENTSASTFLIESLDMPRDLLDDIIVHEVAHQWLGNLVTCRSWTHLWLNEGWATYAELLWREEVARRQGGDEAAREAYLRAVAGLFSAHRLSNRATAPESNAMLSPYTADESELFGSRADNIYSKGALVLHMLRARLGDDLFQQGTRLYIDRHRFQEVETDQLRYAYEDVSGLNLEHFFDQWCRRPGIPRLAISRAWDVDTNEVVLTIQQTQPIDKHNPAFVFDYPVEYTFADGSTETHTVRVDSPEVTTRVRLNAEPTGVRFDPGITVLAAIQGQPMETDVLTPRRTETATETDQPSNDGQPALIDIPD